MSCGRPRRKCPAAPGTQQVGRPDYTHLARDELAVATSDLNGDGASDLVAASFPGTLTVLLGCPE